MLAGSQSSSRIVDDGVGNRLRDDSFHDLDDGPLLGEAVFRVAVIGLDLVAKVPVRQKTEARREQPRPGRVDDVMHPDVVPGDVLRGVGVGFGGRNVHRRRNALRESLCEARFGPLAPCPLPALAQALVERGQGEVEKNHEGELVGEKVVAQVRAGIVRRQRLVEGAYRPDVEVRLAAQVAVDLVQMPVEGFEHELHAREKRVARRSVARVVIPNEGRERLGVAVSLAGPIRVVLPPESRDLGDSARDSRTLRFAVLRHQLLLERAHRVRPPWRLRLCERRQAAKHQQEDAQTLNGHAEPRCGGRES